MARRRRLEERITFGSRAVHHHRLRRRPDLEVLEGRALLSTFTVNSLGDAGSGSGDTGDLRYCINQANADDQANTIVFDSTLFSTPQTITLSGGQLELSDTGGTQTITGPTAGVTISGGGKSRVCQVDSGVTASFSGLAISGGSTTAAGGGLYNDGTAMLTDCTLSGNSAASGGGLFTLEGTDTLTDCTVSGNFATSEGGGVQNTVDFATLTMTGCTISGNSSGGLGGGVLNGGSAQATLTDCTLSGNSAAIVGGGVFSSGTATLTACTVNDNQAGRSGGGVYNGGVANLTDTIIAGNLDGDIVEDDYTRDTYVSGSNNLIGTGGSEGLVNGVDGNIVLTSLTNLGLAPLANYGGPTQTMALLPGSAAIGAGVIADYSGTTTPITTDQRGDPLDTPTPDIGAYQVQSSEVSPPPTIFTVNSTGNGSSGSGTSGTLPYVISQANVNPNPAGSEIEFDFSSQELITLNSTLVLSETAGPEVIEGPGANVLTVSGGNSVTVFDVEAGVTAAISGLTISGGSTTGSGGGLFIDGTATVTDCTISGNTASGAGGGGLVNYGTITLSTCTISGNLASGTGPLLSGVGGGVANVGTATLTDCAISGNSASGSGGGVGNAEGAATLTNCTISGNSTQGLGGGVVSGDRGTLALTDCTISGNSAVTGGGVATGYFGGTATITGCTISANGASSDAGGVENLGTATLTDTIVAGNVLASGGESDIGGSAATAVTGTYNLIGTGGSGGLTAAGDNLLNVANPLLAPLGNYGGPTETMALLPGSPALGAGIAISGITTDQRGEPLDSPVDIGAFQSQGFTITSVSGSTPQTAFAGTQFGNVLAVVVTANNPLEPVAGGVVSFSAPSNGASAILWNSSNTIDSNAAAYVFATANLNLGSYAVTASAAGAATPASFDLTNSPAPSGTLPIVNVSGSATAVRQQTETFTLNVSNASPADQGAGFIFFITWGDGSPVQLVSGLSGVQVTHVFTTTRSDTILVSAIGDSSNTISLTAIQTVQVVPYALVRDAANTSLMDLEWGGSNGINYVRFVQTGPTTVEVVTLEDNGVMMDSTATFTGVTGSVIALGGPASDTIDGSGLSSIPATLNGGGGDNVIFGGGGVDTLIGGSDGAEGGASSPDGSNLIVAGAGPTTIYGSGLTAREKEVGGDNLIIGGSGNDVIYGNYGFGGDGGQGGQNLIVAGGGGTTVYTDGGVDGAEGGHGSIVVAGTTSFGTSTAGISALESILVEWTSSDPLATKIADISGTNGTAGANGDNYLVPGTTVFESSGADTIYSDTAGSANWLLYSFALDSLNNSQSADVRENLDPTTPADTPDAMIDDAGSGVAASDAIDTATGSLVTANTTTPPPAQQQSTSVTDAIDYWLAGDELIGRTLPTAARATIAFRKLLEFSSLNQQMT